MAFQQRVQSVFGSMRGNTNNKINENSMGVMGKANGKAADRRVLGDISRSSTVNASNRGEKRQLAKDKVVHTNKDELPAKTMKLAEEVEPMDLCDSSATKMTMPFGVDNIDLDDAQNPQLVTDYVYEIDAYMKKLEVRQAVPSRFLSRVQTDINDGMRAILLDWLVEVHIRFKLTQETLFMTIHILDRFLADQHISRSKLQLAGITSMLIASKYEDMYPPEVRDFIWIADNAYTRAEIIKMEGIILKTLDYNLGTPLPLQFFRRLSKATAAEAETHNLGKYLMELSVCNYNMCGFTASQTATAATYLAHTIMSPGKDAWSKNLEFYSGYTFADMNECIQKMSTALCISVGAAQQAVRRKFGSSKLLKVSALREVDDFIANGGI